MRKQEEKEIKKTLMIYVILLSVLAASAVATTPRYNVNPPSEATLYDPMNITLDPGAAASEINAAIHAVSLGSGGTVVLNAGTYTISEPIIMKSRVCLKGSAQSDVIISRATIWQPTSETGMIQTVGGLSDVIISDLTVDGTNYRSLLHGIMLIDNTSGTNYRLYIKNTTVKNCAGGVHIKGSQDVILKDCTITGNGDDTVFWHNVYLRRCERVLVTYCTLSDSLTGVGIQGTHTNHIEVSHCTIRNNYRRGIRSAGTSSYILARNNEVINNGDYGIGTNPEETGTPGYFCFIDNIIQGNGNYGINANMYSAYGQIASNVCTGNNPDNYTFGSGDIVFEGPQTTVPATLVAQYEFEGNAGDRTGNFAAMAVGSPVYTTRKIKQAIDLDGIDDYVLLPGGVANSDDITMAAWVYWDGGSSWQRIFDFGNNTTQYLFLTPRSGNNANTLRFAIKNGGSEQFVETTQLPTGVWVHVAVTLEGNTVKLYVNGTLKSTNSSFTINPSDFKPIINYIGDSQWSTDPLFTGSIDDFRVYNFSLTETQVTAIMAGKTSPVFTSDPINGPAAVELTPYSDMSLASFANDADGINTVIFSKVSGPAWLAVAQDGTLSGIPSNSDVGNSIFSVQVTDADGFLDKAAMNIQVANIYSGVAGLDDLIGLASQWLTSNCTDFPTCGGADLDGDADVDMADMVVLARNWQAVQ